MAGARPRRGRSASAARVEPYPLQPHPQVAQPQQQPHQQQPLRPPQQPLPSRRLREPPQTIHDDSVSSTEPVAYLGARHGPAPMRGPGRDEDTTAGWTLPTGEIGEQAEAEEGGFAEIDGGVGISQAFLEAMTRHPLGLGQLGRSGMPDRPTELQQQRHPPQPQAAPQPRGPQGVEDAHGGMRYKRGRPYLEKPPMEVEEEVLSDPSSLGSRDEGEDEEEEGEEDEDNAGRGE